jgi:6-phosphogluconolactonase
MSDQAKEFVICRDAAEVSRKGAELLLKLAVEAARNGRRLSVALSGGSTPKTMFEMLAAEPLKGQVPWPIIDLFWGDERCVPPDHKDSNYRMTKEALLDRAPIPSANIRRIPAEEKPPSAAAEKYQRTLSEYFGLQAGQLPRFDLVYLGMGDDGHTASLFPGTKALGETERFVTQNFVDKFQSYRVTLTADAINNGKNVVFLLAGEGKAGRLKEVLEGPRDPDRLPSQMIQPAGGKLVLILDRGAAGELSQPRSGR